MPEKYPVKETAYRSFPDLTDDDIKTKNLFNLVYEDTGSIFKKKLDPPQSSIPQYCICRAKDAASYRDLGDPNNPYNPVFFDGFNTNNGGLFQQLYFTQPNALTAGVPFFHKGVGIKITETCLVEIVVYIGDYQGLGASQANVPAPFTLHITKMGEKIPTDRDLDYDMTAYCRLNIINNAEWGWAPSFVGNKPIKTIRIIESGSVLTPTIMAYQAKDPEQIFNNIDNNSFIFIKKLN